MSGKEYRTITDVKGPLVFLNKTEPVSYGEIVQLKLSDGSIKNGQVLDTSDDQVIVQVFEGTASVDNDLCWSPIGSLSVVFNDFASALLEYRSGQAQAAASFALTEYIPIRFTWGVNFAAKNEALPFEKWTWVFRASASF